jgi:hypothetical protein
MSFDQLPYRKIPIGENRRRVKGCTNWSTPDGGVPVPTKSTAVFDFVYRVHGRPHTDDNAGTWYLAQPE